MSSATILEMILLFVLIVAITAEIVANYKTLSKIEKMEQKQKEILLIVTKSKANGENATITLEKIIEVSVRDDQSETNTSNT